MKLIFLSLFFALCFSQRYEIEHDRRTREYLLHVPSGLNPQVRYPLVVNIHALTQTARGQASLSGMDEIADREKFIVVYPEGYGNSWSAGPRCCAPAYPSMDDVGFIKKVVADVAVRANVDLSRVYSTGMSNGAYMSYRLACDAWDVFAAIAPVAGASPYGSSTEIYCSPKRAVSLLEIHGTNDLLVPYRVTEDSIETWAGFNGCGTRTTVSYQKRDVTCDTYIGCPDSNITLCTNDNGGHVWPFIDIDTSEEIWAFLQKFTLSADLVALNVLNDTQKKKIN